MKIRRLSRLERIRKISGFTLIEMMIVLAIIGILAALATTNYVDAMPKIRAQDAMRKIWSDMYKARSHAAKTKRTVVMLFDVPNNRYSVVIDYGDPIGKTGVPGAVDKYLVRDKPLGERIIFASGFSGAVVKGLDDIDITDGVELENDRIFFQRTGHATNDNVDGISSLLPDDDINNIHQCSIYIMHEMSAKNWKDSLYAIKVEPLSSIPTSVKYDFNVGKWPEKAEEEDR